MVVNFNAALEATCQQVPPDEASKLRKVALLWKEDEKVECLNRYLEMIMLPTESIELVQKAYSGFVWQ